MSDRPSIALTERQHPILATTTRYPEKPVDDHLDRLPSAALTLYGRVFLKNSAGIDFLIAVTLLWTGASLFVHASYLAEKCCRPATTCSAGFAAAASWGISRAITSSAIRPSATAISTSAI